MADWRTIYAARRTTADEAIARAVRAGQRLLLHGGCAEPQALVEALVRQRERYRDVRLVTQIIASPVLYAQPEMWAHLRLETFMCSANTREAIRAGQADYIPANLSDMPGLFRSGRLPVDVALIQVSPPDAHGYCSLGLMVDFTKAGVEQARVCIAQVNRHMPRAHGDCFVHVSRLDHIVEDDRPLLTVKPTAIGPVEEAIGRHIAALVNDGDTIQFGIGAIPDAALRALIGKRDLGIHSGLLSDTVVDLVEAGAISGRRKAVLPGKIVSTAAVGTRRLYDAMHDNPLFAMMPSDFTHHIGVLAQLDNFVSINSALQVDLTGQVNAETLGTLQIAGTGGGADFVRGAAAARNGRSIMALPATAGGGKHSRIVAQLDAGAAVTTPRADVHYVVTEYGVADLKGKSRRERAAALIAIAHPDFRPQLEEAARLFGKH
jgi:4-hydroxybutyrate CoA-transferase